MRDDDTFHENNTLTNKVIFVCKLIIRYKIDYFDNCANDKKR
jgi:hypothetical protein